MSGIGFTMGEILSQCPTGWSMEPDAAADWLDKNMIPVFPLGEVKKPAAQPAAQPNSKPEAA
jgi:2-oxoglutarate ferredoxin oxidoreductase subunit beta